MSNIQRCNCCGLDMPHNPTEDWVYCIDCEAKIAMPGIRDALYRLVYGDSRTAGIEGLVNVVRAGLSDD